MPDFSPLPFETETAAVEIMAPPEPIKTFPLIKPTPKTLAPSQIAIGMNGNNTPDIQADQLNAAIHKRRMGRMSMFNEERAGIVIEAIEEGETMETAAERAGVKRQAIWTWMQLNPAFNDAVSAAREFQGHASADNAVKILDSVEINADTDPKLAMAQLRKAEQRARIRMDLAKCFNNRQYGDTKKNVNLNLNAEVSPIDLGNYR